MMIVIDHHTIQILNDQMATGDCHHKLVKVSPCFLYFGLLQLLLLLAFLFLDSSLDSSLESFFAV